MTTVTDQRRSSGPLAVHGVLAAIALTASIVLLVGGYMALTASGGWFAGTRPLEIRLEDALVVRGQSVWRGPLWAPTADAEGILIIRLTDSVLDTATYPTLRIAALADAPPMSARLIWRQAEGSRNTFAKTIAWKNDGLERLVLAGDPEWHGKVSGVGLVLRMQPRAALLIRSATLLPDTGRSILAQFANEWFDFEPWGEYSVNYLYGGSPNPRLLMVPAMFLIAAVAFAIYFWLARRKGLAPRLSVGVALALVAWIALDARWQLNVLSNLRLTAERYAGKTMDEKHRAAEDANIYLLAEAIRRGLPPGVTSVTLVSDLANLDLFVGKLRYYLFPLALLSKPDALEPRTVLAIVEPARTVLDPAAGTLKLSDGRVANVEILASDSMVRMLRLR
ncbi:MAG: hypothetical protein ABI537_14520 [Casimicrobiaceae bacterium]